jgi:GxxExxY protein
MTENEIGTIILEAAIEVHRTLGPGLLESVYEGAMEIELAARSMVVQRQVPVPVQYKGLKFEEGFRADLVVNGLVIVEFKSIENISKAHRKQIQTYLRLTGMKLGYILNFGCELLEDGIVRAVNGLDESPLRASGSLRENE